MWGAWKPLWAVGLPEHADHRREGLDLGRGAVEVDGDDGLVDAGLGVLAVATDLLLDGADAGVVALGAAG